MRWQTPDEAPDDPIGRFSLFFDTPIGFGWAADARPPTQFSRGSDPADRDLAEEHEALRRWRSHPAPGGGFTSGPGDLLWSLDATSSGELALVHWEDVEDVPQLPTPQVVAVGYAVVGEARWVVELACQEGSGGPAEPILRCDTPDPGSGSSGAMSAGRGHIARSLPGGRAVVNVSPWRAASGRGT